MPSSVSVDQLRQANKMAAAATTALKSRHSGNFTARLLASSMGDPDECDESEEEGTEELELW